MCDEHQRRSRLLLALEQQTGNRFRCMAIEIAGRFVGEENFRLGGHGARDSDTLLLPAGELRGIMAKPMSEADRRKFAGGPFERLFMTGKLQRHGDIFQCRHRRQQMKCLKDDADMTAPRSGQRVLVELSEIGTRDDDIASARAFKAREHRHQRRLSRAGCSEHSHAFSSLDIEVQTLQYFDRRFGRSKCQRDISRLNDNIGPGAGLHVHERKSLLVTDNRMKKFIAYGAFLLLVQFTGACGSADENKVGASPDRLDARTALANNAVPANEEVENRQLVVAFGDSLFAGYRLDRNEGFASALERKLVELGKHARVFNAAVSGDTSAAGLQRLAYVLDGLPKKPDLIIVCLGGNDMLRGLSPDETRNNLKAIMDELSRRDIDIVLAGMVAAPNMGRDYARAFNPIYSDLGQRYHAPVYPFVLDGVIGDQTLLLDDGIHPNAKGIERIVAGIVPTVAKALDN